MSIVGLMAQVNWDSVWEGALRGALIGAVSDWWLC
jgi:hypothetical protein